MTKIDTPSRYLVICDTYFMVKFSCHDYGFEVQQLREIVSEFIFEFQKNRISFTKEMIGMLFRMFYRVNSLPG